MTITTDRPVPQPTSSRHWAGLHLFLRWESARVDAFLLDVVRPRLTALREAGAIEDWFFIRYAEDGPHLRIRVRGAGPGTADALAAELRAAVPDAEPGDDRPGGPGRHGEVRAVPYAPETDRYGGAHGLPVAEEVFCRSTALALDVLAAEPDRTRRLTTALDLYAATAAALDLDEHTTVRWLRAGAVMWRLQQVPGLLPGWRVQRSAQALAAVQGPAVHRRWSAVTGAVRHQAAGAPPGGGTGLAPALRWAALVRDARAALDDGPALSPAHALGVWASQLHMLCNRIGILPDEERATGALAAAGLLAPAGPAEFFGDGPRAADRRYLSESRFEVGLMEGQTPRSAPPEQLAHPFPPPGRAEPLPEPAALPAGLADALDRRGCARGDLGGRVTATDVATLVHGAAGSSARAGDHPLSGTRRRPYPSPGAAYVARLRLAALAVDGVPRGLYDVGETDGRPVLRRLGPAPEPAELVAASMWFTTDAAPDRIDAATLPAVLGLYVRTDVLRATYGRRALRFALLEAGHLAQNLALVAAATGLATTPVGGFYDDTAHEVLLLDGVDDVLAYLLPLGRVR